MPPTAQRRRLAFVMATVTLLSTGAILLAYDKEKFEAQKPELKKMAAGFLFVTGLLYLLLAIEMLFRQIIAERRRLPLPLYALVVPKGAKLVPIQAVVGIKKQTPGAGSEKAPQKQPLIAA